MTERESLFSARLTVDEYGTVWLGEPGEGEGVGDLLDRDEETLQIVWRCPDNARLAFGQAVDRLRAELLAVQNAPHEEQAGPLCPICGLTTSLLAKLEDWRDA